MNGFTTEPIPAEDFEKADREAASEAARIQRDIEGEPARRQASEEAQRRQFLPKPIKR